MNKQKSKGFNKGALMRFGVNTLCIALLLCGCTVSPQESLQRASSESNGSDLAEMQTISEPEAIPLIAAKEVEALPEQVKLLAQTTSKSAHLFSFSPDGNETKVATFNEYVYANPKLSPDGSRMLLRVYERSADGQKDLWSANLVTELATGNQQYCKAEPLGSKNMQWVGQSVIGCVIASKDNNPARTLNFFDEQYRAIESPYRFAPPSDTRVISGVWMDDSYCYLVVTEQAEGVSHNDSSDSFLNGSCHLETVDRDGTVVSKVELNGYAAPINNYMGFGSAILPTADGRLLIRLYPLNSPQQNEFYRERWVVAESGKGVAYEIPDANSILAFDGKQLFYSGPSIEENNWLPEGYLCTLGKEKIESVRPFPLAGLRASVGEKERDFRVLNPSEHRWAQTAAFSGDRLWISAAVEQRDGLISANYGALFYYDLKMEALFLCTLLPNGFPLAGSDKDGNAMILGALPYYRYEQDDYQVFEQGSEARQMQEGTDFWNQRGQLLMAADLPLFDQTGIADPVSLPNEDRLWRGINRVYAYLFWQNGESPAQYTLSAEQLDRRLQLLFGDAEWPPLLKERQNPDGSYTLTELFPDPEWDTRPWIAQGWLDIYSYGDNQNQFWALYCTRECPQSGEYEYRQLILEDCEAFSRLVGIREE